MGGSGAGKTSLFNILAGRAKSRGGKSNNNAIHIDAKVYLGGVLVDSSDLSTIRKRIAFVAQEDTLHVASTPREAIRFSAKLRLPKATTEDDIDRMVDAYIKELGLEKCADSMIGGGLHKGISGGEKKRTSIGVELVVCPSIILLDEPTSGLDSFSAEQVVNVLNKAAMYGASVLFTIHQPSSSVFMSIDRLILLNRGRIMYQGDTADVADDFTTKFGYPVPPTFNPAEWVLRVAQEKPDKELESKGFYPEDERSAEELHQIEAVESITGPGVSVGTQLSMLIKREKNSFVRNKAPMIANVAITSLLSVIYGIFFLNVGSLNGVDPLDLQARLGSLVNILITTMMGQSQLQLTTFPTERPLFLREYATNHYSVFPYFVSHLVVEALQSLVAILVQSVIVYFMISYHLRFSLFFAINYALAMTSTAVAVMLGSVLSDASTAPMFFTLMVVPQFYFSGVFMPLDVIPKFVRWAQWLCSLRYAAALSLIYEFGDCEPGLEETNCENLLERNDADPDNSWWYWLALCYLFVAFRLIALAVLTRRALQFA